MIKSLNLIAQSRLALLPHHLPRQELNAEQPSNLDSL